MLTAHDRLREFAVRCLQSAWRGSLDGAEAQEIAVELGLLREGQATQQECEQGFEGDVGDVIYRLPAWLAKAAKEQS